MRVSPEGNSSAAKMRSKKITVRSFPVVSAIRIFNTALSERRPEQPRSVRQRAERGGE
jgi:hypothetical protein